MKPTLYLMMGLPGSGKTTAAKALEHITGATRLSSDEVRVSMWATPTFSEAEHTALYEFLNVKTQDLLQSGKSVIYDANLNRKEHREEKYALGKKLGMKCVLIWVKTKSELARQRRIEDTEHQHLVPTNESAGAMFDRVAAVIEEPSDEPYIELDGTKITSDYVTSKLHLNEAD